MPRKNSRQAPEKKTVRRHSPDSKTRQTTDRKHRAIGAPASQPSSTKADISAPVSTLAETESREPAVARPALTVVGIGASAGGLEAFSHLLKSLPSDTGLAYVYVQHLDPTHESILSDLLSKSTAMPVRQVEDGVRVQANHVYVIPPNKQMIFVDGTLSLSPRVTTRGQHLPIDSFLRSLAQTHKSNAIGVILSGTGADGALGIEAIKSEGGFTFAQDSSAHYGSMPRSAVASGCVDFVLAPEEIAKELTRIARHPYVTHPSPETVESVLADTGDTYGKVLGLLKARTGMNFSNYRHSTIKRRISRRMALRKSDALEDYFLHLRDNAAEVDALYEELLIKVTSFFREPETFEALKHEVFGPLLQNRPPDLPIRIWVPACATGEEAYSLAIVLLESLGDMATNTEIQIFATDISESSLERARAGIYPENIALDVSPERLRRFFTRVNGNYQISKTIRDMCIFAKQNVIQDPPFSKVDLITCRNLLIYLEPVLQKKILPIFHYALRPGGFLLLGNSETIGSSDLFREIDKKHRIYVRKEAPTRMGLEFMIADEEPPKAEIIKRKIHDGWSGLEEEANRLLLKHAPPAVIIDQDMDILQFRGHTGPFLEPASGRASLNILKMAREGLLLDLRTAIQKARATNAPVKKQGIRIKRNGGFMDLAIEVFPISTASSRESYFVVLFQDLTSKTGHLIRGKPSTVKSQLAEKASVRKLRGELDATKEYLQSIIEEQEATHEELKSANEELMSSNEELQSTNEERETAKEELQSANEELTTVNEELQNRNMELNQLNNDLINLLTNVNHAVIILGNDLRIRRFTPTSERLLNLLPTDLGRPITEVRLKVPIPDLSRAIEEVIESITAKEFEAQDDDGHWYAVRIRPYKTMDNNIDGVVISIIGIDDARKQLHMARDYADAIMATVRVPVVALDAQLRVQKANALFYRMFAVNPKETENRRIYEVAGGQWNIPQLRTLLEEVLPKNTLIEGFQVDHTFPELGRKSLLLNARRIQGAPGWIPMILLSIEDISEQSPPRP
jgi:two-component system, chemotaxis family, CheB/CheR fusion protein